MRIVIAGAHGQVARRLGRLLSGRGDAVVGIVRNPAHSDDLRADGVEPVVLDLEQAGVDEVAEVVSGADAVVFAAGAGAGSGEARKHTVDKGAALLLADAAERAGVRPYLLVSSMGVEQARQGTPRGMDPVFAVYLQAKLAAEDAILPPAGSPWPTAWSTARCRGTTSPRCCSRCWTPARPTRWWNWSAVTPRSRRRAPPCPDRRQERRARVTSARAASSSSGGESTGPS